MLKWRLKYAVPIEQGKPTTYEQWFEKLADERAAMTPPLPPPAPLLERPDIYLELAFLYSAFWELDASRPVVTGPGPIPYGEVTGWLDEHDVEGDLRDIIRFLLMEMDRAYLEHRIEKAEKQRKKQEDANKNKNKRRGRRLQ